MEYMIQNIILTDHFIFKISFSKKYIKIFFTFIHLFCRRLHAYGMHKSRMWLSLVLGMSNRMD